jgi:3-methylcrotonyl-CoA carboxylase alpha subunit
MFKSVLIANRGEIACRIARSARRLGLRTVAVYSDADAAARHVALCDEAHHIGASPPRESYLDIVRLIEAARRAKAECVHPGYGFLAENAEFAEAVAAAGMVFVGPPPSAIRAMGLKDAAKTLMEKAGVPIVPGYHGERQEAGFLKQKAYEIGYPVLIKPVAGGGGKGMRRVDRHAEFELALEGAVREAQSAFGDGRVLIEKYVSSPRHIEIQVFADQYGNTIHLIERDCSLQRRHQKVIEEAPAPGMTRELRNAMGAAAVAAAKAVDYAGAGTVEFIVDGAGPLRLDGFWFMEMNTRLQVEHPVTEAVTGLDLVEWQFRVAAGEALPLMQDAVPLVGHAIEARLYAEDPERGFIPSTGRLAALEIPTGEGIRIDSGVVTGSEVTPFYDPMIAKIIAHGEDRAQALDRLTRALEETVVAGPRTNAGFLAAALRSPEFRNASIDTGFIDRHLEALGAAPQPPDRGAAAAGLNRLIVRERDRLRAGIARMSGQAHSPWAAEDGFTLGGRGDTPLPVLVDGARIVGRLSAGADGPIVSVDSAGPADDARIVESGETVFVLRRGRQTVVQPAADDAGAAHAAGDGRVRAPMHGKLLAVLVAAGQSVERGQRVAVVEAMKMEHTLFAPIAGVVESVTAVVGAQIAEGGSILHIRQAEG